MQCSEAKQLRCPGHGALRAIMAPGTAGHDAPRSRSHTAQQVGFFRVRPGRHAKLPLCFAALRQTMYADGGSFLSAASCSSSSRPRCVVCADKGPCLPNDV